MQNKLNLELKYFCNDFSPIRKVLKSIGARKFKVVKQKDYFFNLPSAKPNARLKLRIEDKHQTLIYYERGDFQKNKANPAKILLYPNKDKNFLKLLTDILGIKAIVTKTREQWKKDNTVFNLDIIDKIGKIFEIEITTSKSQYKKDEALFNMYKELLQSYLRKIIKGSNVDLVSNQ